MPLFRGKRIPKGTKILRPVRPNVGIEVRYRRQLDDLIRQMHESTLYWIKSAYKNNEPRIAQDAVPSEVLRIAVARLAARWQGHFDEAAQRLADYFATAVEKRSTAQLMKILKDGGWTVRFTLTPAMRDVFQATVNQNVALIKSIPQQYLSQVEGLVQRSIQAGGDLKTLTDALMSRYSVTRSRAELIARDQNAKANSTFNRARQQEMGIKKAIWMHSHAGETPRPTHVKMNNTPYDVAQGMWDPHEQAYIWPGQLIACKCYSRSVVEGFS